ncbi:MAG: PHB depolymerase family esterase [Pseudomonadota bacterium]
MSGRSNALARFVGAFALIGAILAEPIHAATRTIDVMSDSSPRSVRLFVPDKAAPKSGWPALLILHGGGGNISSIVRTTAFDELAEREGFVAVYPAGTGPIPNRLLTWNAGDCCGPAARHDVDDVSFIRTVIDTVVTEYRVDAKRVYVTGYSNGAMMAYRLGCALGDRIAAIAPVGGTIVYAPCTGNRRVPLLQIHGTADQCVRFGGGLCGGCLQRILRAAGREPGSDGIYACRGVVPSVNQWAAANGCRMTKKLVRRRGAARCEQYQGCDSDVELCSVTGGGHLWPGRTAPFRICERNPNGPVCQTWGEVMGPMTTDLRATDVVWEFVRKYKLP